MKKIFVCALLMVGLLLGYSNVSLGKLNTTPKDQAVKQPQPSDTITYNEYAIGSLIGKEEDAPLFNSEEEAQAAIKSGKLKVAGSYSIDSNGLWKDLHSKDSLTDTDLDLYDQLKDLPKNKYEIIQDMGGTWHPYLIVKIQ